MEKVFAYIDQHADEYIERLLEFCRQPSISAQGVGMLEAAQMVKDMLDKIGAETQIIPTETYPLVFGQIPREGAKTIMFYNHYDVQPPGPLELWESDPFEPKIRDGRIYARGTADNKGCIVARIYAVDAYQQVYGQLPVQVKFIMEGEEETGSRQFLRFIEEHPDMLAADGWIEAGTIRDSNGRLWIIAGSKGVIFLELRVKGIRHEQHSGIGAILPNPLWRLVWALGSLKDSQERVLIPGFYDRVTPPTEADLEAIQKIPLNEEELLAGEGVQSFLLGLSGLELAKKLFFEPVCNIDGLVGGHSGQGMKTTLPSEASAKLDLRLVPDQDPDEVLRQLRAHLDAQEFDDVEISDVICAWPPTKGDLNTSIAQVVISTARQVYGTEPVLSQWWWGSGPMYFIRERLGIPAVTAGVSHEESYGHGPNENIYVEDFIRHMKHMVMVLHEFGKQEA